VLSNSIQQILLVITNGGQEVHARTLTSVCKKRIVLPICRQQHRFKLPKEGDCNIIISWLPFVLGSVLLRAGDLPTDGPKSVSDLGCRRTHYTTSWHT